MYKLHFVFCNVEEKLLFPISILRYVDAGIKNTDSWLPN